MSGFHMGEEGQCWFRILAWKITRLNEIFKVCVAYDFNEIQIAAVMRLIRIGLEWKVVLSVETLCKTMTVQSGSLLLQLLHDFLIVFFNCL